MITIDEIAKKLEEGELVVFIGSGVSRSYKGMPGIPTAEEMVELLAREFPYIKESNEYKDHNLRFEIGCQMLKQHGGDRELINFLCKNINKPNIKPLPAYNLLSRLPFNSYFTTNFDRLLEDSFSSVENNVHVIVEDEDVAFWKSDKKPIVKLHGCINKRESIVAAIEDYKPFKKTKPLIDSLAKVILASKTILFIGFALQDEDFIVLFNELQRLLGDYMGQHMAVVVNPTERDVKHWQENGITLVNRDLTDFLNELAYKLNGLAELDKHTSFIRSPYLKKLHDVTNSPTETMAIDVFLEMLEKEINSKQTRDTIIDDFHTAAKAVFKEKPNFLAFIKECNEIVEEFKKFKDIKSMMDLLKEKKNYRDRITTEINKHAKWIQKSSQILIYSQSVRVIEFLKSVPRQVQESCTLYICECRTKSPTSFYDAKQVCMKLEDTSYKKYIITDSSVTYLMKTNQIQSVLMGAHAVYTEKGKLLKFVNTSGSDMIAREAEKFKIPIFVIAEEKKICEWNKNLEKEIKYTEKYFITRGIQIDGVDNTIEIAYDLCDRTSKMKFINENYIDEGKDIKNLS